MTDADRLRTILGLSQDVVDDDTLAEALTLAQEWCDIRAAAYGTTSPDSAVTMMVLYFLRQNLDIRGIKPSSISMPDLSMSTDLASACSLLKDAATEAIKAASYNRGSVFRHIRSGKVARWR